VRARQRGVCVSSGIAWALLLGVAAAGSAVAATATIDEPAPVTAAGDPTDASTEPPALRYQDDRLTADVSHMSVHALLAEIGRQSGARIRMEGVADREVSAHFARLPLADALRRILGEENFTLVYGRNTGSAAGSARLREIQVFGDGRTGVTTARLGSGGSPPPAAGAAGDPSIAAGGMMMQLSRVLEKHGEIQLPPGSSLAATLGSERASFHQLVGLAMRDGDRQLRAEAAEVLAGVFDSDPDAHALLAAPGDAALDPEMIASFVRASGGPHAEEFLGDIAQHLRTPALRAKVNQIRARLHGTP